MNDLIFIFLSVLASWILLWSERNVLGWLYHLVAFPIGLLLWVVATSWSGITGFDYSGTTILVAFSIFTIVGIGNIFLRPSRTETNKLSVSSYVIFMVSILSLSWLFQKVGYTIAGWDSIVHYEIPGLTLMESGRYSSVLMGEWSPLLPSMHAANRFFGVDWTYVPYPILACNVLVLLGYGCYRFAFVQLPAKPRAIFAILIPLGLGSLPAFVFQALHVHSQMISALYLLVAILALRCAQQSSEGRGAFVVVAGFAMGGLSVARPDGLAYMFVPGTVAAILIAHDRWKVHEIAKFVFASLSCLLFSYICAFVNLGLWESRKLSGKQAIALLMVSVLFSVVIFFLPLIRRRWPNVNAKRAIGLLACFGASVVVIGVALIKSSGFQIATSNMITNLLFTGGYGALWWGVFSGFLLSILFFGLLKKADFSDMLGVGIFLFFAIAIAVHSISFPGRLHPADSFNRVAFHILPIALWFLASFGASALVTSGFWNSVENSTVKSS